MRKCVSIKKLKAGDFVQGYHGLNSNYLFLGSYKGGIFTLDSSDMCFLKIEKVILSGFFYKTRCLCGLRDNLTGIGVSDAKTLDVYSESDMELIKLGR